MTEAPLPDPKAEARRRARAARAAAHSSADPAPALALLEREIARRCPPGGCVAGYAAIRSELDPRPALERLHDRGFRICLPVVEGPARPLHFRLWEPASPLVAGAFGAMVPDAGSAAEPDLLIVPLLAFDAHGFRLGYGGGYYDRTLETLRAQRAVTALGLAYAAQAAAAVPVEPTDQKLDAIVTETGLVLPR